MAKKQVKTAKASKTRSTGLSAKAIGKSTPKLVPKPASKSALKPALKPITKSTVKSSQKTASKSSKITSTKTIKKNNVNKTGKTGAKKMLKIAKTPNMPEIKENASSKLDMINSKLDKLLSEYETMLNEERKIEAKEDVLTDKEDKLVLLEEKELGEEERLEYLEQKESKELAHLEETEKQELDELQKLEELEMKIKRDVEPHPLAKITIKDFFKGSAGAFIGLVVHFSFNYVYEIAEHITLGRATFLYFFSFFIGATIMYATGFRKVTEPKLLVFWPLRVIILYLTALLMSIIVLYIFGKDFGYHFAESYIQVSVAMISAIIGATTADMIGRE